MSKAVTPPTHPDHYYYDTLAPSPRLNSAGPQTDDESLAALIGGVAVGILVAVLAVAALVLWCLYRRTGSYATAEAKGRGLDQDPDQEEDWDLEEREDEEEEEEGEEEEEESAQPLKTGEEEEESS